MTTFSRLQIVGELGLPPERYATIIHPSATVSSSSSIGPGTVLLAHVDPDGGGFRRCARRDPMPQVTLDP